MAALSVTSRRLPGMTQRNVLPIASVPGGGYNRPIELPHLETFPGAACYRPIELPCYKAAPLQAFGPLNPQRVCNPSLFIPHPSSALAFLGYSSSTSVTRGVAGLECWSPATVRIAPRPRGVKDAVTAADLSVSKFVGYLVRNEPSCRRVVAGPFHSARPDSRTRTKRLGEDKSGSPFGTESHPNFPNPNPGKHVNSSILEPNASTISELLVHSAPFSTL